VVFFVKARDIGEAWIKAVLAVLNHGKWVEKEDSRILEVEDMVIEVEDLSTPKKHPDPLMNVGSLYTDKQLEEYAKQYFEADVRGFTYTYGERLRAYRCPFCNAAIDQIDFIKAKLSKFPSTNQAVAVLYNPLKDPDKERHNDPPCWNWVQFRLRNGELHVTALFRSHDYCKGLYPNLYAIAKLAESIHKGPRKLVLISTSAHIYESDYRAAQKHVGPYNAIYRI